MKTLLDFCQTDTDAGTLDLTHLAIVTVTYHPDVEILDRQLGHLPASALKILVDNASGAGVRAEIARLAVQHEAILLQNDQNMGLATALNRGIQYARQTRPDCQLVLLLDQDTEPKETGVARLAAGYERLVELAGRPCCVGPRLVDAVTGLDHGFHQIRGLRWMRCFPRADSKTPVLLDNLNGSGTLMPFCLVDELGGLEDDFFIDHIDTEWAFRVLSRGYPLYGIPDVAFHHRMGDQSRRLWFFGWRIWPDRSPQRHYYLFRNASRLMRRDYVPRVWKAWAVVKLVATFLVHLLFDPRRLAQARSMCRGIRDA